MGQRVQAARDSVQSDCDNVGLHVASVRSILKSVTDDERSGDHESMDTRVGLWILGEVFRWPRWAQVVFVCVVCFAAGGMVVALSLVTGSLH
jgi:hypothetical protein